jgi:hypothetical protein
MAEFTDKISTCPRLSICPYLDNKSFQNFYHFDIANLTDCKPKVAWGDADLHTIQVRI